MQQQKEKTSSALILEAFGSESNRQFSPSNNANTDNVFLSDNMLLALCQLLQQKLENDQRFDVEIVWPFLPQKSDLKSFTQHLAVFRETLMKKALERKQETLTILIPFKTSDSQWQLMILTLQEDKKSYRAEVISSINLFSLNPQSTSADIVTAHFLNFSAEVQQVLGRISGVTYSQSVLQNSDQSSASSVFMNMLSRLNILDPSTMYPTQSTLQQNTRAGESQGLVLTPEAELDWRVQVSGLLFFKTLYQENPKWRLLTELLPNIDCQSNAFSRKAHIQPNLLFVIAERAEDNVEFRQFLYNLLNMPGMNYYKSCDFFGNSILLWAISRLEVPSRNPQTRTGLLYKSNVSDLYDGIQGCSVFVDLLMNKIIATPELHLLLTQANVKGNFSNTPLLMALKNYNISLACQLVPYYDLDSLLVKTWAKNTILHFAAYYRIESLIDAILDRAKSLGSDALPMLLTQENKNGKVPAQCYYAEKLPASKVSVLCESSQKISIGSFPLKDPKKSYLTLDLDKQLDDVSEWILGQEFLTLGSFQEGAHRFTDFARGPTNSRYAILLKPQCVDLSYSHLEEIFTPKTQPVIQKPEPVLMKPESVFRVYFRNNCSLKDQKVRQSLVDALFTHFSDTECSIYVDACDWSQASLSKEHQVYDLMLIRVSNEGCIKYETYHYKILAGVPLFDDRKGLYLKEWGDQQKLAYEKVYEKLKPTAEEKLIEDVSRGMQNK